MGSPEIASFLKEHKKSRLALPIPSLYEIYYGFYFPPLSKRFKKDINFLNKIKKEEQKLTRLLDDINIFDLTLSAVKKSAEISSYLDSEGYNIGKFDSLIAGIILANGYNEILTRNIKHYDKIPDLIIHSY